MTTPQPKSETAVLRSVGSSQFGITRAENQERNATELRLAKTHKWVIGILMTVTYSGLLIWRFTNPPQLDKDIILLIGLTGIFSAMLVIACWCAVNLKPRNRK